MSGTNHSSSNLYQINTRPWLKQFGSLSQIPLIYWQYLKSMKMDYVWLTGIWQIPVGGKELAMSKPAIEQYKEVLPDFRPENVDGSPFAIDNYSIDPRIGTLAEIIVLRQTLQSLGIRLILDFIPNHFGSTSEITTTYPEIFLKDANGQILNGKDPHFDPWIDTAQVNYSTQNTIDFMIEELLKIADICDGVRCDMAMLIIRKIFSTSWNIESTTEQEFWIQAIDAVKVKYPNFIFIGECYWGLEIELIKQGFDFVYNKTFLDALEQNNKNLLEDNLKNFDLEHGVHFLENHDEPRSASIFDFETLKTNASLLNSLPGLKLYFDGQWQGYKIRIPIQLNTSPIEETNPAIESFYKGLLQG